MKCALFCIFLFACTVGVAAQAHNHQQGTIVRMGMTTCEQQHRFVTSMSGTATGEAAPLCPEYVLVSDKVVYVVSGKSSEQLLPLAEVTRFRLQKNEMLIRIDDAQKESHFHIKAMVLRPDWDRNQMLQEAEATAMVRRNLDPASLRDQR
jgi:hypothetical protein